jgi:hypothetical protein
METPTVAASNAVQTHTPGPWKMSPPLGEGDYAVLADQVTAGGNFYIATLPLGSHAQAEANARLIAAAPAMLEYVRAAVATLSVNGRNNSEERMADLAKRARAILRDVEGA